MGHQPLVLSFPMPDSELIRSAYWDLYKSEEGADREKQDLDDADQLPRPWDIATCTDPDLRRDVWAWYEAFVTWFNHEYVWDPAAGIIPPCWPQHPHLVHDIGVLADQRRMIATATNSNSLEEWHRLMIPDFLERVRTRIRQHCDDTHQAWPSRAQFSRYLADAGARSQMLRAVGEGMAEPVDGT